VTPWKRRSATLARCFQAFRIVVNDEMGALDDALTSVHSCVREGGRLVVMSYHSLEDRRVKHVMRGLAPGGGTLIGGNVSDAADAADVADEIAAFDIQGHKNALLGEQALWAPLFKKAKSPTEAEIESNKRARSAKLRVAVRSAVGLPTGTSRDIDQDYLVGIGTDSSSSSLSGVKGLGGGLNGRREIPIRGRRSRNRRANSNGFMGKKQIEKEEKLKLEQLEKEKEE